MSCSWSGPSAHDIAGTHNAPITRFSSPCLNLKRWPGHSLMGRLYCTPKALWKLNWFLRDFGYDTELLDRDEIDDKNLIGLSGVVKTRSVLSSGTKTWRRPWVLARRTAACFPRKPA